VGRVIRRELAKTDRNPHENSVTLQNSCLYVLVNRKQCRGCSGLRSPSPYEPERYDTTQNPHLETRSRTPRATAPMRRPTPRERLFIESLSQLALDGTSKESPPRCLPARNLSCTVFFPGNPPRNEDGSFLRLLTRGISPHPSPDHPAAQAPPPRYPPARLPSNDARQPSARTPPHGKQSHSGCLPEKQCAAALSNSPSLWLYLIIT
jgi:hypothetical protein